jgi:hypothetical protein
MVEKYLRYLKVFENAWEVFEIEVVEKLCLRSVVREFSRRV